MGIKYFQDQRCYAIYNIMGQVIDLMALLIKVHKQNFPESAYVSQIDDLLHKICKVLTDISIQLMREEFLQRDVG